MDFSICISTHSTRFEQYFKPLIHQIKKNLPDVELIIFVNSQVSGFVEEYRKEMLMFLSQFKNTYPIFSPMFRGCAKMWNTMIVHSSNHYNFIFNDDIYLLDGFFLQLNELFAVSKRSSFRLNGSFSHFFVNRFEIFEVGYFDERLIGVGEEDGDWCYRWEEKYQRHLPSFGTQFVVRYPGWSSNIKEKAWNADWIFKNKYNCENPPIEDTLTFPANGRGGMYGVPVSRRKECIDPDFYPTEKFFWENIHTLNENLGIKK